MPSGAALDLLWFFFAATLLEPSVAAIQARMTLAWPWPIAFQCHRLGSCATLLAQSYWHRVTGRELLAQSYLQGTSASLTLRTEASAPETCFAVQLCGRAPHGRSCLCGAIRRGADPLARRSAAGWPDPGWGCCPGGRRIGSGSLANLRCDDYGLSARPRYLLSLRTGMPQAPLG